MISAVLIEHFDELILLKSGGRVVYHGELGKDSQTMIKYFEKNGAKKCPEDMNPAEYMLEGIAKSEFLPFVESSANSGSYWCW